MELLLKRETLTEESTVGSLFVNGVFECYTLEDKVRKSKIKGKTAIPSGRYEVVISFSNRFQKFLPLLLDVPNFEGIRIHSGNTANDTEGCILVGKSKGVNSVLNSRAAFVSLFQKIQAAVKKEKVWIEVK